ncbi:MAG TPA: type VI secretion system tube protein Hcp, partial [Gemmataceae bacterium]|nr:type VI secretion system tube protein Hcp [Gemmataceae bacterium]
LAAGTRLTSVTIHVRKPGPSGAGPEYLTYTLKNVFISSYTTSNGLNGGLSDTIRLHFDEVTESYAPINPDGSLGSPNVADYNQATGKSGGAGKL